MEIFNVAMMENGQVTPLDHSLELLPSGEKYILIRQAISSHFLSFRLDL
jgi:hypothetical protein